MTIRIDSRLAHPLFGISSTRRLEAGAAAGMAAPTLMALAGASVARLARALAPHAGHIWVACGPGNNGGDGFEAAAQLRLAGVAATVVFGGEAAGLPADARMACDRARQAGVPIIRVPPDEVDAGDLYIDAVLGLGSSSRQTTGWIRNLLDAVHRAPCPVLCVDLPSGLSADTGQYVEDLAPAGPPKAQRHTLSLITLKPGLFTAQGRDAAGTVWFDSLGVDHGDLQPDAVLSGRPVTATRSHASHKGTFGDVGILGGEGIDRRGMGMSGAALLAGTAALHSGAGRVLVAVLDTAHRLTADPSQPELMLRKPEALDLAAGTLVCGCGGGEAVLEWLPRVLRSAPRLVLDADALNHIAADTGLQQLLAARALRQWATVLTPHPLEAARLLGVDTATVQADRLAAAHQLAARHACVVALKGSGTVIAAPGCIAAVNPTGNGRLATAGTGDVLAGMTGASLATLNPREMPTMLATFDAVCRAVFRHGQLADDWPDHVPLTASGLARQSSGR